MCLGILSMPNSWCWDEIQTTVGDNRLDSSLGISRTYLIYVEKYELLGIIKMIFSKHTFIVPKCPRLESCSLINIRQIVSLNYIEFWLHLMEIWFWKIPLCHVAIF